MPSKKRVLFRHLTRTRKRDDQAHYGGVSSDGVHVRLDDYLYEELGKPRWIKVRLEVEKGEKTKVEFIHHETTYG